MKSCLLLMSILLLTACRSDPAVPPPAASARFSFEVPKIERWDYPNGFKIFYYHDDELPLVEGALFLRGGTLWEEQPGAAAAMGQLMREGGAGALGPDELDNRLYELGAEISSRYETEYGRVDFTCLSPDFEKVMALAADVVAAPQFNEKRLEIWKSRQIETIRRRKEDPETVAETAFKQLLFGDGPYGRVLTTADIRNLRREHLAAAHKRMTAPHGAVLAISGNLERSELRRVIDEKLGSWLAAPSASSPLQPPELAFRPTPGIYFIELPFAQAAIWFGQQGPPRHTDDEFPIKVFNELFGSGELGTRLLQEVRLKTGLSYAAFGALLPDVEKGKAVVALQTKAENGPAALTGALKALQGLQEEPAAASELRLAQGALADSFVFKFEHPVDIVERAAILDLLGYPPSYDEHYLSALRSVSAAQVQQTARRYWTPAEFIVVVVGPESAYNALVSEIGTLPAPIRRLPIKRLAFGETLQM